MKFGRCLDQFIRWFYICGLSCYPCFDGFSNGMMKSKRFVHYIPTGVLVVLAITTSISTYLYKFSTDPDVHSELNLTLILINTLTPMLTIVVCAIQMVFLSPYFAEICSQISIIERLSWQKCSFDSKAFKRHFMQKISITAFAYMLPIVVSMFFSIKIIPFFYSSILKALLLLVLIQAFFYIDLLDHMLKCFVRHIDVQAANTEMDSRTAQYITEEISQYKHVHFHLWEISEKINQLFGWIIVAIVLQYFAFAIFNVFWAFKMVYLEGASFELFRKMIYAADKHFYSYR